MPAIIRFHRAKCCCLDGCSVSFLLHTHCTPFRQVLQHLMSTYLFTSGGKLCRERSWCAWERVRRMSSSGLSMRAFMVRLGVRASRPPAHRAPGSAGVPPASTHVRARGPRSQGGRVPLRVNRYRSTANGSLIRAILGLHKQEAHWLSVTHRETRR